MTPETLTIKGSWRIALVDASVTDPALVPDEAWTEYQNIVVNGGLAWLAKWLNLENPTTTPVYVAVGTNNTAPAVTDTQLGTENARVVLSANSRVANATTYTGLFNSAVANTTLYEAGVFFAASGTANSGTLFNRVLINVTKTNLENLLVQIQFTFGNG